MHSALVFASVLAVATAAPQILYSGLGVAPVGLTSSQYHAQDELGQYSYGYAGGPSAKTESKDAFGNVRGSYSYIDSNGITQTTNYVADPVNGFRAAATNLPVGPAAGPGHIVAAGPAVYGAGPAVYAGGPAYHFGHAGPAPVADTPEVAIAKVQHAQAHAQALARSG